MQTFKKVVLEAPVKAAEKMDKLRVADAITEILHYLREVTNILMKQCLGLWQRTRHSRTDLQQFFTI